MRKLLVTLAALMAAMAMPAFAQDAKVPPIKPRGQVAHELYGIVGGKDKVLVTVAADEFSIRALKKLTVGAECYLLPGDRVERMSVNGDVVQVKRLPGLNIKPGTMWTQIRAFERSKTCPYGILAELSAKRWDALNAAHIADAKQREVDHGPRKK